MAIGIGEVATIHEAEILNRIDVGGAAVGGGGIIHGIDRRLAVH